MLIQNQIHRTLSEPDSLSRVGRILSEADGESRSAIGRRVCEAFGISDGRGRPQLAGCMKALRNLEAVGGLRLPAPRCGRPPSAARRVAGAVPAAVSVPGELSGIGDVAVLLAESDGQRRIWSALMADEHPHGMATFAGCQLRYLVSSSHGWLSAVGFSVSTLCLSARDRWMGWSSGQRRDHLHRVVCLSRFLIRPGVRAAPTWRAMFWVGFCGACRGISRHATVFAPGLWRPSWSLARTGPVCARRTSSELGRRRGVVGKTVAMPMQRR